MREFQLRRVLPALIALALAAPALSQAQTPQCKSLVDHTWVDGHKEGPSIERRPEAFRNAVVQMLNPIVTRSCFDSEAHRIGADVPQAENSRAFTLEEAKRLVESASSAYFILARCPSVASYRADLMGSLVGAPSLEAFEGGFAKMYGDYVSRIMHCEAFNRYLAAPTTRGLVHYSPSTRYLILNAAFPINSPPTACRIVPGDPCSVQHGAGVPLLLINVVKGESIVTALQQFNGASSKPITVTPGAQNIQVPIDQTGKYLLTVLLNNVQAANPTFSVSLAESCVHKTDIVYFRDPTSKLGQVEIEVH